MTVQSVLKIPPGYELELNDLFEEAIQAYLVDIKNNPQGKAADFAVRGIMRCLDALDRYKEVLPTMEDFIKTYPGTQTAFAAKDLSLPLLIQQRKYDLAIEWANEFLKNETYPTKEPFYYYFLASIYDSRSDGKAGADLGEAVLYYSLLIEKFPEMDIAFWAGTRLNEFARAGLGKPHIDETHVEGEKPMTFSLEQNYPNPFNPATTIQYQLARKCFVLLKIYNIRGQIIRTLIDNRLQNEGMHRILWDGLDEFGQPVTSGVYVYRLVAGTFVKSNKMIIIK